MFGLSISYRHQDTNKKTISILSDFVPSWQTFFTCGKTFSFRHQDTKALIENNIYLFLKDLVLWARIFYPLCLRAFVAEIFSHSVCPS